MRVNFSRNAAGYVFFCFLAMFAAPVAANSPMQNFVWHKTPVDVVDIGFKDGAGKVLHLSDFKGRVVLLNFWATWCAPCRREMPDLDALHKKYGGKDFLVLALSQDRKGLEAVKEFYGEVDVKSLELYIDQKARTGRKLRVPGLPTTILLSRKGQEIGRLVGPAEWFSEDAQKIVEKAINLN
ncbi:MAG: TlpA family protein disulfide reductase [Alphaproteobacteria bacterium]|jgi:thiol-disulfide isomerase/thioredoxin|nr:TlpA family protein disulfide reductase [Alphaproteobacteria bacterium]MBT4017302.1 TlpA family protein disulfide reductase [Alphaproteobacteria bacterium]MBT4965591.1 TlpA family protein disulfide reductase [Alphaproteobacteria bacterium]MBT5161209.1 TlpA family protein disulfide reductase [Alphaproteobacteria bacterium]MBT5918104.1 TlpA family protein disulfide reductase [Alphaproteobacteria bacterium]